MENKNKRVRYNWEALKLEFMQGPWETVSEFRRYKGMPPHKISWYITKKTFGWSKEKREMVALATRQASGDLVSTKAEEIKKIRERQSKIARYLQVKGMKALDKLEPTEVDDARKLVIAGLREERSAVGIPEKGGVSSLTQVNVNLPKTKFDELIDGQDFEGVLKFIADVRRERVRRIGANVVSESQTETNNGGTR